MYGGSSSNNHILGQQQQSQQQQQSHNNLLFSNYQQDHLINHGGSPLSAYIGHLGGGGNSGSSTSPIYQTSYSQSQQSQQQSQHQQQQQQPVYNPNNGLYGYPSQVGYGEMGVDQQDDEYYDGTWFEMRVVPEYPASNIPNPITCLKFDPWEELLWIGYQNGKISSLINPTLDRFSSFFVDKTEIKDLLVDSEGILSLSKQLLSYHSRGGAPIYQVKNDKMKDLNAISFTNYNNTEIVVGSDQNILFVVDFYTGKVIKELTMPSGVKTINKNRGLWCGQVNGEISMLDPRTWKIEHSLSAHKGDIKSVDIKLDLLVSCGCSPRLGQLYIDPIVKVYDIKTLRSLPPIQYKRPSIVKFHPVFYSTIAVVSESSNQIYLTDVQSDQSTSQYYQVDSLFGYMQSFDISQSGEIMALGDSGGLVHQWAEKEDIHVNVASYPTECVPFTQLSRPQKMDETSPLGEVIFDQQQPDPYLLSFWKPTLSFPVGLPPRPINPSLLVHLKQHDFVGYISNTGISRKQIRGKAYEDGKTKALNLTLSTMSQLRPPKAYRWGEMKFKKFGIEDFDMIQYNRTKFSGLENILPNSYSNSCIQNLYFIPQIKETMLNHLCTRYYCLSCELGFVFQMMDKSAGNIVDTSNFIRVLKQIPQTSALGIFLSSDHPDNAQIPLPQLIANFNRFILEQIQKEMTPPIPTYDNNKENNKDNSNNNENSNNNNDTIIDKLFSSTLISSNKCINCGYQYEKLSKQFQYDISYPNSPQELGPDGSSFSNILKQSLCKQIKSPAWCEKCQTYSSTYQKKLLKTLPNILCLNANCLKKENEEYWKFETTNIIPGSKTFKAPSTTITATSSTPNTAPPSLNSTPSASSTLVNAITSSSTSNSTTTTPITSSTNVTIASTTTAPTATTPNDEITWLPLKIRIKIDENGQLLITEYPNNPEKSKLPVNPKDLIEEVNEDGQLYELSSCISHIKDQVKRIPKQGHLITQIKVSDYYDKEFKPPYPTTPVSNATTTTSFIYSNGKPNPLTPTSSSVSPSSTPPKYSLANNITTPTNTPNNNNNNTSSTSTNSNTTTSTVSSSTNNNNPTTATTNNNTIDLTWFNFNDFKINPCSPIDVTHFDSNWKTPAILYYTKIVPKEKKLSIPEHQSTITKEVYLQNNIITCKTPISFVPATSTTLPVENDYIAIDTEFVSIGPEETEVSSDGKRVIIQPGNFSLARVSIVRENGEPFIDDYIQSIEPVTDYLTRFSGINPGDLDPKVSTKNVISLKSCYLKLRYLVDQKVKFVGHGLKKDFRIINIYVPPDQIIDTVELFQLRNQRKLSLRFLAYILLKIDIQTETHCSVEDAKTAMDLYKAYLILVKNKEFDETLNKIYQIGRGLNFRVPEPDADPQTLPPSSIMNSLNFNFDLNISISQLLQQIKSSINNSPSSQNKTPLTTTPTKYNNTNNDQKK